MSNNTDYPGVIPPPPGITPDLNHPQDSGYFANFVGMIVCGALITVFFSIRMYMKTFVVRQFALEDWSCLVAYVGQVLYLWTVFMMTQYGLGYHAWEVSKSNYVQLLKWLWASSVLYIPACYFTKVTLLLLIARVFAVQDRVARGIHLFMVVLGIAYLPVQVIKMAICVPIQAFWDPQVTGAHCLNQRKVFLSDLSLAVLTDGVILVLPIVLTWSLRMPWERKLKIMGLLGIGGAAMAVTIFRMYKVALFIDSNDTSGDFVVLDLTTAYEMAIGMICACFPAVNMIIERKWRSRTQRSPNSLRTKPSGPRSWRTTWGTLTTGKWGDTTILPTHTATAFDTREVDECGEARASRETGVEREARESRESILPGSFDLQLAKLTGKPVEESIQIGPHIQRIRSSEGWKEGWLAPRGSSAPVAKLIDHTLSGSLIVPGMVWDGRTLDTCSWGRPEDAEMATPRS